MLRIDTIAVLVPATWSVPGARAIPTTQNKDNAEGRVEPVLTDVEALLSAGVKLPGGLFEAEGTNEVGGQLGVRVGVYDTGGGDPFSLVREAAARITPSVNVGSTNILGAEALRIHRRPDDGTGNTDSLVCDYWARMRAGRRTEPNLFLLLRFWRTGPGSPGDEEVFEDIAGSFLAGGPAAFAGPMRPGTLRMYAPPESETAEPGRFRYAGWRLGTVFHSKMISAKQAEFMTELGVKVSEGFMLLALFLAWLAATVAMVGMGPILLLGTATTAGAWLQLRSRGLAAVGLLAVGLFGLLVLGVATS